MATFACKHLCAQAFAHDILSEIQHGGLPGHQCADHLYHLKALYAKSKRSYSLFIDFNKAFNSVPHGTLWTVLERANFSASTISLIKQLYSFPQDSPIINGRTPHAYLQTRGLRQGCPLSPLLFILYLNSLFHHFFATVPPPRANARTSHHAYIDDILIRSEDVNYVQNSLNYFDGPARDWGLDMNVSKTEVHANGTAPQKEFLTPRGSEFHTYNKKTGRPHTCYKYLGVYLFTCHQAKGLFHMLKAEIQSYFARLSPLPLTLSEKVRLTNSQLVPALAYRLITHSLSPNQLEKLQALISAGVASRSITRLVSLKDRFAARPKRGLGMKFLPHSVHVATVNYGLRALNCGLAPKSVGPLYVQSLLSSNRRASDPVQNSFMDSIHALGISFHSIGPWRPPAIRDLTPGTQLTVRFKSGQATGRVTEATSKWANVSFHDGVYSVDTHTSYTMHMPCHAVMDYSHPSHFQLVPEFLRPQETIPQPAAPPHNAHALGISQHGHLFALQAQHYLEKKSLDEWGRHVAAEALTRPPTPGLQRVWLYSDGSSGESGHAAAITAFLPDGTTRVLCLSSPHPSSLGSEFWGAVAAIRWINRELSQYEICLLIDNEQVVSTLQKCQVRRPSPFQDDTWTVAVHSAVLLITNPLHIMWIKGHANFIGNEICDHFSKWAAHSLIFTPDLLPPPPLGSVALHHLPVFHKFKVQQFRHLLPRHSHSNIAVGPSFSLYNKTSWFSSLFFKLASGCYNVHGYQWSNMLHDYHCSRCGQHHPFDPLSCLAFCKALDQHVQAYVSSWGTLFSPIVLHWWLSGPSKADRRNFMRTLVPKSLWSCLSKPIPGSTRAEHRAMLGLALEERVKHLDKAVHQAHDWLCSNRLPWDPILWAHPSDPLNPFSVSHGAFSTPVHMPPQTRPVYQHPPPLPKHALKKPSKPASAKAQPTTRRTPKNSKSPSSRASAPRPPPPLGHSPPSSALTPTATTKTPSITTNPSGHNRLGAPKARQDRSPPPTPKLQSTLPSNTPTSPLKAHPY